MGYIVEVREHGKSSRRLVVDDRVEPGQIVTEAEGRLYLLIDSQARVLHPAVSELPVPSARLGPGDAFSLAALLGDGTGSVLEAVGQVTLFALDALDLARLPLVPPALAAALTAPDSAAPREGFGCPARCCGRGQSRRSRGANADPSLSRPCAPWAQPRVVTPAAST